MACKIPKPTVEPVLFTYMMGVFIQYPVFQAFLYQKICRNNYNATICRNFSEESKEIEQDVQTKTAHWMMVFMICITIPSVISALFMGSWGDHFGRRLIMLLPIIGNIIMTVTIMISIHFMDSHVGYLLIGAFLSGFTGGFATILLSVFSYMADITDAQNRTVRISVLESMTAIGGTIGLAIGGPILEKSGSFMVVFVLCLGLHAFIVAYIALRIRSPAHRQTFSERSMQQRQSVCRLLFNTNHIKGTVITNFKKRPHNHRTYILLLNMCMFLLVCTMAGDVVFLFTKLVLKWNATTYGFFMAAGSLLTALGLLLILPILKKVLHFHDATIAIVGVVSRIAGHILMAFGSTTVMMFLVQVVAMLGLVAQASLRSILSTLVAPHEQGKMYSFVSSLECLAPLFSTIIFNNLYRGTFNYKSMYWWAPGISFIVAAICLLPCLAVFCYLRVVLQSPQCYLDLPAVVKEAGKTEEEEVTQLEDALKTMLEPNVESGAKKEENSTVA